MVGSREGNKQSVGGGRGGQEADPWEHRERSAFRASERRAQGAGAD